jgi:hypothetical protein
MQQVDSWRYSSSTDLRASFLLQMRSRQYRAKQIAITMISINVRTRNAPLMK